MDILVSFLILQEIVCLFSLSMMSISLLCITLMTLRYDSYFKHLQVLCHQGPLSLSNAFLTSIEMIMWPLFLGLFLQCVILLIYVC